MENDVINATNKDKDGLGTFGSFKKSGLCLVIKETDSVNTIFVKNKCFTSHIYYY